MKLLLFIGLLLHSFSAVSALVAQSGLPIPEFNDPLHGMLIVSRYNPPFLTLKANPDRAYYVPTDEQVETIRQAVYSGVGRFKRSSNDSSNYQETVTLQLKMVQADQRGLGLDTLSQEDFEIGMKTYKLYAKYIGKMIIGMFSGYLNVPPIAPPDLPFNSFDEKTYFKATVVETKNMKCWLEDVQNTLREHARNRPYFPVNKVILELHECENAGYSEVSDKDFEFNSETGGIMTYYKVMCMTVKTNIFVFLALHDNEFALKPNTIEKETPLVGNHCSCGFWFCWWRHCWNYIYTKKEIFTENRYLTAEQQKELNDYLIDRVVQRINTDNKEKIDIAMREGDLLI